MTSPNRSVAVRLSLDPSSFVSGAARAEASTLQLDRAVQRVGPNAATSMDRAAAGADRAESSFGRAAKTMGAIGVAAAAVGTFKFLQDTITLGNAYQGALNQVQAVTGATAQQMAAVRVQAKALGNDLSLPATSASDAALAMENLAKGGLNVDQAMQAAKGTLQLAAAAQIDGAQAADIQSAALNTFHLQADQANHVADVLANTANMSAGDISDFALGLQQAGNVASVFGIGIEDTSAALGIFANNGLKGSDAGTSLKTMLTQLTNQSKPAQAAMKELGLNVYDAQGHFIGLAGLSDQLSAAQKRMSDQEFQTAAATVFGTDAIRAAAIMAKTGGDGFEQFATGVGKAGGASTLASAQMKGLGGAWEGLQSQIETEQLDFYDAIAPELEKAVRWAQGELPKITAGIGHLKDEAVADFQAVVRYLQPLISGAEDFGQALFAANGPADIFWHALQTGGRIAMDLVDDLHPLVEVGGEVLHLFSELPGPVQTLVIGLVALKTASKFDLFSGFGKNAAGELAGVAGSLRGAGGSVATFVDTTRLQLALAGESVGALRSDAGALAAGFEAAMPRASAAVRGWAATVAASAAEVSGSFLEAKTAAQGMATLNYGSGSISKSTGDLAGFTAATKTAAKEGVGGLKAAAGGLVSFLGGPWVVGLMAAGGAVWGYNAAMDAQKERLQDVTDQVFTYGKQMLAGGDTGQQAAGKLADLNRKLAESQKAYDDAAKSADTGSSAIEGYAQGAAIAGGNLDKLKAAMAAGRDELDAYKNKLGPLGLAQAAVAAAAEDVNRAQNTFGLNSPQAEAAAARYRDAQTGLETETKLVNSAMQDQISKLSTLANQQLMAADASLAAQSAQLTLDSAVKDYNDHAALGSKYTGDLAKEGVALAQQAYGSAQAIANEKEKQAEANGATNDGIVTNAYMLQSLKDTASHLTGPARDAMNKYIAALDNSAVHIGDVQDATTKMGLNVTDTWDANTRVLSGATAQQIKDLQNLGFYVKTLPDGKVVVTSDTGPARTDIDNMISSYRHIEYTGSAILVNGRVVANAEGNLLTGAATPMSSSVASVVRPGTLRVIGDNPVADEAFIPINNSPRSMTILGETASRMGMGLVAMAGGGVLSLDEHHRVDVDSGLLASYRAALDSDVRKLGAAKSAAAVPDVGPVGAGMTWPALDRIRRSLFPGSVLTSAYRAGANDWHGRGDAIDIGVGGNSQAGLMPIAATLARLYPGSTELIHNPNGSIKNGSPVSASFWGPTTWAQHANHVHWAMTPNALAAAQGQVASAPAAGGRTRAYDTGGYLDPGVTVAVNGTGKRETVRTAEQEQAVQAQLRTREVAGGGLGGGAGAVTVNLTGAQLSGRMELGADGFVHLIDGRIETLAVKIKDRMAGAGVGA